MIRREGGRACRGAAAGPGECAAPGGCTMALWRRCRQDDPERARNAVEALARGGSSLKLDRPGWKSALVEAALRFADADLVHYPQDRILETFLSDLARVVSNECKEPEHRRFERGEAHRLPRPPEGWNWDALVRSFQVDARNWLRRRGHTEAEAGDFAQEALFRLCREVSKGINIRFPRAWVRRVFASLARESSRGRASAPLPPRFDARAYVSRELWLRAATQLPEQLVAERELAVWYLSHLPQPHRRIAYCESIGFNRREIVAHLQSWRPIGEAEARRLIVKSKKMLKVIRSGRKLHEEWPRVFSRKNPWKGIPPPQLLPLRH